MWLTLEDAYILAKGLKEKSHKVQGVELFGSILKNGKGHDVDFMLTVDDQLAKKFWAEKTDTRIKWPARLVFIRRIVKAISPWLDKLSVEKKKQTRLRRASSLIGLDLQAFGNEYRPGTVVDVWLLPYDWRTENSLNLSAVSRVTDITDAQNTILFLKWTAAVAKKIA